MSTLSDDTQQKRNKYLFIIEQAFGLIFFPNPPPLQAPPNVPQGEQEDIDTQQKRNKYLFIIEQAFGLNFFPNPPPLQAPPNVPQGEEEDIDAAASLSNIQIVDKIFDLPVVHDTYNALVRLSTPLSPYVEKIGTLASVVDQALDLKAGLESKLPEVVKTGCTTALNKVATAAVSLDTSLCSGVDNLVEKVPALKQSTPALYNSTKESISSYATLAATYVASFTIAHVALKVVDISLETSDGLLMWTGNEQVDPILIGLRKVRSEASSLRKEGVNLNGTEKARVLEEATLLGALLEIFGLGSYYNQVEG